VRLEIRPLAPYRVQLRREGDSVTLGGHLPDATTRDRLLATLRPKFFHERIVDRSRLAEGAPAGLTEALNAGAEALSVLARGEVRVADRSLTLTGDSLYPEAARRLETGLPRALPAGWQGSAAVAVPGVATAPSEAECRARFAALEPPRALVFSPGSATVTAPLHPLLDAVALWAKACPAGRIAVAGHTDPAGAAEAPKPTVDTAVESTASVEKATEAKGAATKPGSAKPEKAKAEKAKTDQAKTAQAKSGQAKPEPEKAKSPTEKPAADAPPEPEPDLPRQRALALTEYLLQAGLPPDRIAADPAARAPGEGIGLALRP
jgi:outer membrane protein OmpA-like peptidoglycan-associated protein